MDNKNNKNKRSSKDLEQNALEMLNKAINVDFDSAEATEKKKESAESTVDLRNHKENEEKTVRETEKEISEEKEIVAEKQTEIPAAEDIKNIETEKEEIKESDTDKSEEFVAEKQTEIPATEDIKNIETEKEEIKESDTDKSDEKKKVRTKEEIEKEDAQTKEELRNLISVAIENKKILRKAQKEQQEQNAQPTESLEENVIGDKTEKLKDNKSETEKETKKTDEKKVPKVKAKPIASEEWDEEESIGSFDDDDDEEPVEKKKGFFAKYKKTKITVITIVSIAVLIILFVIFMFLRYMGFLNRHADNSKNFSSMPVNDSDKVSGDDTFDKKKKEEELKKRLMNNTSPISDADVFNVLIIGEDVRDPKETGRGNTDVMMIVSVNKKNKTITLTSLLRDVWVYLDEYGTSNKLNAAFWHGGSDYLEKVIEDYYKIDINRYASVNFQSFIDIVEAVGGLDFNVKANEAEAMKDPLDEVNDILGRKRGSGYVKAGKQHLDGYQALAYSRIRYNCGDDYGRTQRQRAVISQIIEKSKKLSFLELDSLCEKVLKKVTTDITNDDASAMLLVALQYHDYTVQQLQIPAPGHFETGIIDNLSVLLPDWDTNALIIQNVIYGTAKNVKEAEKLIANGTGVNSTQNSGSQ